MFRCRSVLPLFAEHFPGLGALVSRDFLATLGGVKVYLLPPELILLFLTKNS